MIFILENGNVFTKLPCGLKLEVQPGSRTEILKINLSDDSLMGLSNTFRFGHDIDPLTAPSKGYMYIRKDTLPVLRDLIDELAPLSRWEKFKAVFRD